MKSLQVVGKKKTSVARASIKQGSGIVRINSLRIESYREEIARQMIMEPLILAGDMSKTIDIDVNVQGGGTVSQSQAIRASIAKALVAFFNDKDLKDKFLAYDRHLLVADIRQKEMRTPYRSKARARRQKSKR